MPGDTGRGLFDLNGRTAVVTGAAGGIGVAAARALGNQGAKLVLHDKSGLELEQVAEKLREEGLFVTMVVGDITSASDIEQLVSVATDVGPVDIIVNCAGIIRRSAIEELSMADLDIQWDVNVRGTVAVTQAFLPQMRRRRWGKVINVGSLGSVVGLERRTAYASTKGAVAQYTVSLALEVGRDQVCVNAIAPGYVETAMSAGLLDDPTQRPGLIARIPLGRLATPADLEGAFVFLAAPASDYITGHILLVDGGWTTS